MGNVLCFLYKYLPAFVRLAAIPLNIFFKYTCEYYLNSDQIWKNFTPAGKSRCSNKMKGKMNTKSEIIKAQYQHCIHKHRDNINPEQRYLFSPVGRRFLTMLNNKIVYSCLDSSLWALSKAGWAMVSGSVVLCPLPFAVSQVFTTSALSLRGDR